MRAEVQGMTTEQRADQLAASLLFTPPQVWNAHILAALREEREACAKLADGLWNGHIAAAIRGRQ